MKKTLVALAALAATSAFAQSSVTIGGIVNYGYHTNTDRSNSVGGLKGDRNVLTFAAVEDAGNGTKVGATAQFRFDSANGAPGYANTGSGDKTVTQFEQTKLSLSNTQFGEVAVGRFTNAIGVAPMHPLEDSRQSTASHQAANGRLSGQVQYMSPAFYGVQVWGLNAKASQNCFISAGGAGYVAAANANYCKNTATVENQVGRNTTAGGLNYAQGPIAAQYYQLTDTTGTKTSKIAGTYDLGMVKLFANRFKQNSDISVANAAVASDATHLQVLAYSTTNGMKAHTASEVAFQVPYGKFIGSFGHLSTTALDASDNKVRKNGWSVTYDLTKRTQLQYFGSKVTEGTTQAGASSTATSFLAKGTTSFVGMQHTF